MSTIQATEITIRPAQGGELSTVLGLLHASGLPDAGLADHVGTLLVAHDGQAIVGSAGLEVYGPYALLRSVAVSPALRGRGLGQDLTRAALTLARARNVTELFLLTETATDFFPRFGFTRITRAEVPDAVKQSVEFTSACPDSAVVMVLKLA